MASAINKPPKYTLAGKSFHNWDTVISEAQSILQKGVRMLESDDFQFILELLSYHPVHQENIKLGVKYIRVGIPVYGFYSCFIFADLSGKEQDFSYRKCTPIGKKDPNRAKQTMYKSMRLECYREAVRHHIKEYYSEQTVKQCCICGTTTNLQVDHKCPSFAEIVNNFEQHFKPTIYPRTDRCSSVQTIQFSQKTRHELNFVIHWRLYHRENSNFQLLCSGCNNKKQDTVKYQPYLP